MAQPSNTQLVLAAVSRYNRAHPGAPIDPQAELAIAAHEGLGGGIGDNGTSFGPNQLHQNGGAYPSFAPQNEQAAQQWAWSPQGLAYDMQHVGQVAGGLKGLPAIEAISTRFERPANPAAEIADAAHHYGLPFNGQIPGNMPGAPPMQDAGGPTGTPGGPSVLAQQHAQAARMLAAAVGNANQTVGLPAIPGIGNLLAKAAAGARP